MQLHILTEYTLVVDQVIDLPKDKTWEDVEHWYVKWGNLCVTFKDGTEFEVSAGDADVSDSVDWKRPSRSEIRKVNNLGDPDFESEPLAVDDVT